MMTKPELTTINQIAPVFIQQYEHYLPTAFNEGMSLLQKVNKTIKALQDVYTVSNDLIVKWNEVMAWVLGEGIGESVSTRLDEMMADGSFASIINQELLSGKPDIIVSVTEPTNKSQNTFWYKDLGDSPKIQPYVTTEISFDEV